MARANHEHVISAAILGEWQPLADYIQDGHKLTPEMRKLLAEILRGEREARKLPPHRPVREKTKLKKDGLVVEVLRLQFHGFNRTEAVKKVAGLYWGASESTVWTALREPFAKKFIQEYEQGKQENFRKAFEIGFIGPQLQITRTK